MVTQAISIDLLTAEEKVSDQLDTFVDKKRAVFRDELPQNKFLTYAFLIQVQLPDRRVGKEHVTCCAPGLVEVDRELHSGSEAYLLTHLLLTSLVPMAWMQAWVSQPKHA